MQAITILWYILKFIFQIVMTIVGIVVIPLFLFRTEHFTCEHKESMPARRFKDKWFDSIFGNREDGIDGDKPYKEQHNYKLNWLTTYNWVAIRNGIHNLSLRLGVNEEIVSYKWVGRVDTADTIGKEGYVHSIATGKSGKKYQMWRYAKLWYKDRGLLINIGYKNFNVKPKDLPKLYKYSFTLCISPLKQFHPAT